MIPAIPEISGGCDGADFARRHRRCRQRRGLSSDPLGLGEERDLRVCNNFPYPNQETPDLMQLFLQIFGGVVLVPDRLRDVLDRAIE